MTRYLSTGRKVVTEGGFEKREREREFYRGRALRLPENHASPVLIRYARINAARFDHGGCLFEKLPVTNMAIHFPPATLSSRTNSPRSLVSSNIRSNIRELKYFINKRKFF